MKTKTESKRQAILKAAAEVFREVGFERASMSEIRARIGGSKATLYNYFPSKEKLFFEVMYQAKELELGAITAALNPDTDDLKQELLHFGQRLRARPIFTGRHCNPPPRDRRIGALQHWQGRL